MPTVFRQDEEEKMFDFNDAETIKARFAELYGADKSRVTPHERFEAAVQLKQADRVPFDFWATPEIQAALIKYFSAENIDEVMTILGIDARLVVPTWIGPALEVLPDGSFYSQFGSHRRKVSNEFSTYEEYAGFPLAQFTTADEINTWARWPKTSYWDWKSVLPQIERYNNPVRHHIRYEVGGIFETSWGLYGLDKFLVDLYDNPDVPCAIMDRITDIFIDNVHSLMAVAKDKIDMVYTYDDIAIQNGLMMSPRMWRKFILPRHQRLNAVIKSYGLKIMYHSCGAIVPMIEALISDVGIDVLNPLQPRAADMDMQKIKDTYGSRIAFHGGIDLQQTMSQGSPQDVTDEVRERIRVLAKGGGYICTTAHYIQADTPIENVLALYLADRNFV